MITFCLHALGKIGDKRALGPLIGCLDDGDTEVRQAVRDALHKIEPDWEQQVTAPPRMSGRPSLSPQDRSEILQLQELLKAQTAMHDAGFRRISYETCQTLKSSIGSSGENKVNLFLIGAPIIGRLC